MLKLAIYGFFLAFPFIRTVLFSEISLLEIPLVVCVLLILGQLKQCRLRLQATDICVLVYCSVSLAAVVNGLEHLHDAARYFRWLVLMPGAVYFVIRLCPLSLSELRTGILLMLPGIVFPGILKKDGHPSYSPNGRYIITDTYPDKYGDQSLLLYDCRKDEVMVLDREFSSIRFNGEIRCDFHPRVSHSGKYICIDCIINSKRMLKLFDISCMIRA